MWKLSEIMLHIVGLDLSLVKKLVILLVSLVVFVEGIPESLLTHVSFKVFILELWVLDISYVLISSYGGILQQSEISSFIAHK